MKPTTRCIKKILHSKDHPTYNKIRTTNLVRNLITIFGRGYKDTTFGMKFDINLLPERRRYIIRYETQHKVHLVIDKFSRNAA